MQKKRLLQDLVDGLSADGNLKKKDAENFLRQYFNVIEEGLLSDKVVKINGLGTMKLIEVDARSSVDVNTGESFLIKEHLKLSFVPDNDLKEAVNKPFAGYEPVPTLTPTVTETNKEPETMKEPDTMKEPTNNHTNSSPSSDHPEVTPLDETPEQPLAANKQRYPDVEDPFASDTQETGERQQTIQEMLEELEKEADHTPWGENGKRRRSALTIILVILGLLFLAGLIYWSIDSNRKAREERALKEKLMEQMVLEVAPLGDSTATVSDLSATVSEPIPTVSDPVTAAPKPVSVPAKKPATTSKPTTTTTKPTTTTPKPATTTRTKTTTTKTVVRPAQITVKAGDRLTQLAETYYGHKVFWVYIYLENKAKIDDPNQVAAGTNLVLPKPHPTLMDPKNPEAIKRAEGIQERILAKN